MLMKNIDRYTTYRRERKYIVHRNRYFPFLYEELIVECLNKVLFYEVFITFSRHITEHLLAHYEEV